MSEWTETNQPSFSSMTAVPVPPSTENGSMPATDFASAPAILPLVDTLQLVTREDLKSM